MPDVRLIVTPDAALAVDRERRTIRGLAIPAGAISRPSVGDGKRYSFRPGSLEFSEHAVLLAHHDRTRAVGKITAASWDEDGLRVTATVPKTPAGDDALALADEGIYGLSVGFTYDAKDAVPQRDGSFQIKRASAPECSLTSFPAFDSARVESVSLSTSGRTTMPGTDPDTDPDPTPTPVIGLADLTAALSAAFPPATYAVGPEPVPAPPASVTEPPCYRFDGLQASHSFVGDLRDSRDPDSPRRSGAQERLSAFLAEGAQLTAGDIATPTIPPRPNVIRQDLSPGMTRRGLTRPLAGLISTGTLTDTTPFTVPRFKSVAGGLQPHTEGAEDPAPSSSYEAESIPVTPHAVIARARITREAYDSAGPVLDAIVANHIAQDRAEQLEAAIGTMLLGLDLDPVVVHGIDHVVVSQFEQVQDDLEFVRGGSAAWSAIALDRVLFSKLRGARDGENRRLLNVAGGGGSGVNTEGATSSRALEIGGASAVPCAGLVGASFILRPGSFWQLTSAIRRFDLQLSVSHVDIGFYGLSVEFSVLDSDALRVEWAA